MTFCTFCGGKLPEILGAFCPHCGERLVGQAPVIQQSVYIPQYPPMPVGPRKAPKSKKLAIWLAVFFGPWAYLVIFKARKVQFIALMAGSFLLAIPVTIQALSISLTAYTYDYTPDPFAVYAIYGTPMGILTLIMNLAVRGYVIWDLARLPKSFYEEYEE